MANEQVVSVIERIVEILVQANVGAPIILNTIMTVRDLWAKLTQPKATDVLSDAQLIDLMEAKFTANGVANDEEIARLRAQMESEG
jgi:hypothetical protein